MSIKNWITEKLNPAQPDIYIDQGVEHYTTINNLTVEQAYRKLEVVQRGVNLLVDSSAGIKFDIKGKIRNSGIYEGKIVQGKLLNLLNFSPNVYQNADALFRNVYLDLLVEGNAFILFDGVHMYHLPSTNVEIVADKKTFIKHYRYDKKTYLPTEIIHIKENSIKSIYRGDSRILSSLITINTLYSMLSYQSNFFKNNAIPGIVISTENTINNKMKNRIIRNWMQQYNPTVGGKRPLLLDGGFKLDSLGHTDFRELDFANSIELHENKILKALGVPPLLLNSGNNANITPNLRLFYIQSVIPLVDKVCAALEFYFGYDLKPDKANTIALRPELKEEAEFYTSMTNAGIMTRNEAREAIRLPKSSDPTADYLILPQNIAGSATDPSVGGAPKKPKEGD